MEGSMGNHWNLEAIFGFYSECIMGSLEDADQRVTIQFTFFKDRSSYYEDSVLQGCGSRDRKTSWEAVAVLWTVSMMVP